MARLSQRAMNNVVIFAMLIMIALFNLDAFLPDKQLPQARPVLTEDSFVLKIEHDGNLLERVGREWRQVSGHMPLDLTPQEQLAAWQEASLTPATDVKPSRLKEDPLVVVIWLAGQSDGQVYAFYPGAPFALAKHNGHWFTLKGATLHQLLPWWSEAVKPNNDA